MNTQGLGWKQRHMLSYCLRSHNRHCIARGEESRKVALSLERRGLIKIVDKAYECWVIIAKEGVTFKGWRM